MNWRKGFYRIWVGATVLWLIAVVWMFYAPIVHPDPFLRSASLRYDEGAGIYRSIDPQPREMLDMKNRLDLSGPIEGSPHGWSATVYVLPDESAEKRALHQQRVDTLMKARHAVLVRVDRRIALQEVWKTALVPPVVLLLAGLGIAWIASGFRRQPRP
jgi:hypothetical protein